MHDMAGLYTLPSIVRIQFAQLEPGKVNDSERTDGISGLGVPDSLCYRIYWVSLKFSIAQTGRCRITFSGNFFHGLCGATQFTGLRDKSGVVLYGAQPDRF
jgi:hypothetical protein